MKKYTFKIILTLLIWLGFYLCYDFTNVIIANKVYVNQLADTNTSYIFIELYEKIKPIFQSLPFIITIIIWFKTIKNKIINKI